MSVGRHPLASLLRDALGDEELAAVRVRVDAVRAEPASQSRRGVLLLGGLAVLAVAAIVWLSISGDSPTTASTTDVGPLRGSNGDVLGDLETATETASITMQDGSVVSVARDTHLALLENGSGDVAFALRRGSVHFDIVPGGPRRWRLECNGVTVEVVGTVFDVTRQDRAVRVRVSRGVVLVRGDDVPDHVQRLGAGQSLHIGARVAGGSPPEQDASGPAGANEPTHTEPEPLDRDSVVHRESPPPVGRTVPSVERAGSPRQLMVEADVARENGDDARATSLLTEIVERYPDSSEAPFASLTLGRVAERRTDSLGAIRHYERALSLGLPASLQRSVEARIARLRAE